MATIRAISNQANAYNALPNRGFAQRRLMAQQGRAAAQSAINSRLANLATAKAENNAALAAMRAPAPSGYGTKRNYGVLGPNGKNAAKFAAQAAINSGLAKIAAKPKELPPGVANMYQGGRKRSRKSRKSSRKH